MDIFLNRSRLTDYNSLTFYLLTSEFHIHQFLMSFAIGSLNLKYYPKPFLTSTTSPANAAEATILGLIRSVRPVGLPCLPLKFRLLEDAQISRPLSLSGFMARHMEHPAFLHSKPASRKISSSLLPLLALQHSSIQEPLVI